MKIANPLNYPPVILIAGITLFLGVRVINLSSKIVLPTSVLIAFVGSAILAKDNQTVDLENKLLEKELNSIKKEANLLVSKAEELRLEAKKLLHDSWQIDLLTAVEYACDRTLELPEKIEQLSKKISGGDSLLSVEELEKKLTDIQKKKKSTYGIAQRQLEKIEASLQRNISLAKQGESARQAQVFSLTNLITESAGILQELQNKFRTADLSNSEELKNLQSLSDELTAIQENNYLL
jgi:hypothetical protein